MTQRTMAEMNASAENLGKNTFFSNITHTFPAFSKKSIQSFHIPKMSDFSPAEVTNNGRPMNPSLSEDSVADTAISKRNSDGTIFLSLNFPIYS